MLNLNKLTTEQKTAYRTLSTLQDLLKNDTVLNEQEIAQYTQMISKKKKDLVYNIYFQGKKGKGFHQCKDGRINLINHSFSQGQKMS